MSDDLTGQIGVLSHPGSFVARGIASITGSHSYHVVGFVGAGQVVSAEPEGVRLRPASDFPDAIVSKFKLNGLKAGAAADWARAQVGKPYAFADDVLIGCERLLRFRFPSWVRRTYSDDGQWQCAELGMAMLVRAGANPWPNDPDALGDRSPGDFEKYFITQGWSVPGDFGARVSWPW